MLKCFLAVCQQFSRVLKPKSPLVSLVAFMLLDPGKQPTHRWKTFSHGKISKSVEKNENKVLFLNTRTIFLIPIFSFFMTEFQFLTAFYLQNIPFALCCENREPQDDKGTCLLH